MLVVENNLLGGGTDDGKRKAFVWDSGKCRYKRVPEKDKFDK
jgi:hypothetical protein